ncbi:hypothetical protein [Ruegeria jejuensis]|uniref:hypothetical protein n=1 Tax=Ruegeria jejuensis TaxID=3233338 RepID=UPI00355BE007
MATVALLAFGVVVLFAMVPEQPNEQPGPALFLFVGAWLCAALVGGGWILGLLLQRRLSPGEIAKVTFLGGWVLSFCLLTFNAFT